jgi:hypothetical protein
VEREEQLVSGRKSPLQRIVDRVRPPVTWPVALSAAVAVVAAVIAHLPVLTGGDALRVYLVFAALALVIVATRPLWRRFTDIGPASLVARLLLVFVAFFALLTMALPHVSTLGNIHSLAVHAATRGETDPRKLLVLVATAAVAFTAGFAFFMWKAKRQLK